MLKSLLLSGFILALAILCAWAVVRFGRKAGQSPAKLRNLAIGFVAGGIAFAAFAFFTDYGQRQVTLFEALLEGSKGVEVPVVRSARVVVEHAGVEHILTVMPKPAFAESAGRPVPARVLFRTDDGVTLVSETVTFEVRTESSKNGPVRTVWDSRTWSFRPARTGPAVLEIALLIPGVHEVFIRIEDPEKRDGERAPGY